MNRLHFVQLLLLWVISLIPLRELKGQNHAADSLSLQDCIRIAWKQNYESQRSILNRHLAEINHREARQNLIPGVNIGIGHNLSQGRRIDLVTNQYINQNFSSGNQYLSGSATLFRGLETLHRIHQQAAASRVADHEVQAVKDRLMLDVILTYVQVLTSQDVLEQTGRRIALTREQLKRSTDLHQNGAIPPSDYYDLKGQLASDLNSLNDVRQAYVAAQISLADLMNIPPDALKPLRPIHSDPTRRTSALSSDSIPDNVPEWLPSLQAAEWRIIQAQRGLKVARTGHSPRLTMGAGFESTYSSNSGVGYFEQTKNNLGRYLSFGLIIPLTDHLAVRNNVARGKINLIDSEQNAVRIHNESQRTISQTFFNLDIAGQNYSHLVDREESFRESFRIATARFEAGDINSVLFLTAKNNMEQAETDRIVGRYEWILQKYFADYYLGIRPVDSEGGE